MTIVKVVGYQLYRFTHTRRPGMYIDYGNDTWPSRCIWFVPGLPMGSSDGEWDEF